MSTHDSLTLTAVIDRFTDSERALEQIRQSLQALQLAEDTHGRAASALETVADRTGEFTATVERHLGELHTTHELLRAALTTAREFLESTDLRSLQQGLVQVGDSVTGISQRLDAAEQASAQRWTTFETRLQQAEELRREADQARKEAEEARIKLEALKQAIPGRTKRKMGLG